MGEVLAARWRPRNAFLPPQGAPRAHFSESYKNYEKIMELLLKWQCSYVLGATLCMLHKVREFCKEMVSASWFLMEIDEFLEMLNSIVIP